MSDFYIAEMVKLLIIEIEDILINVNNKYYTNKNRIIDNSYKLLEDIYLCNSLNKSKRINLQRKILVNIKMLDYYLYQLFKGKEISNSKYKYLSKKLITLTKMIYGWIKSDSRV